MCGIGMMLGRGAQKPKLESLELMMAQIQHRGPDEMAYAQLENGRMLFGHVRLSIIDLKSGQQPMFSQDGKVALTYNGEIYDFKKHRDELIQWGYKFRTHSDTEVLLALYMRYGTAAFSKLNGEYAFLIWDDRIKKGYAVRDRLGVKPLFMSQRPDELVVCSEAKGLLALPTTERAFAPEYFTGPLLGAFRDDLGVFAGIEPVRPGHFREFDLKGQVREIPYWRPTFKTDSKMSFEDAKQEVRRTFTEAVERRMVADVPVGTYLSGGLDSTLVCALMSQRTDKLKAFNVSFPKTVYDESTMAENVAKHFGAQFETIECDSEKLADHLDQTAFHVEQPFANPNSIAKTLLSELVRSQDYKVCITGEGSDEVFGGYPYFKLEAILRLKASSLASDRNRARELEKRFHQIESRSEGLLWSRSLKALPEPGHPSEDSFFYMRVLQNEKYMDKMLNENLIQRSRHKGPQVAFQEKAAEWKGQDLDAFQSTKMVTFQQLSNYLIPTLADRVEMANSVECRLPFLDSDLVELASRIPSQHFMDLQRLREKHLVKEAFSDLLPKFQESEHKHPFLSPDWLRLSKTASGRMRISHLLSSTIINEAGVFRVPFVRRAQVIWKLAPRSTSIWRKVDTFLGVVISTHAIYEALILGRGLRKDRLQLVERRAPQMTGGLQPSIEISQSL